MNRYTGVIMLNDKPHPLATIVDAVLIAAHKEVTVWADCGEVERSMIEPLADSMVMALLPFIDKEFK